MNQVLSAFARNFWATLLLEVAIVQLTLQKAEHCIAIISIYSVFKKEGVKVEGYYTAKKWILGTV